MLTRQLPLPQPCVAGARMHAPSQPTRPADSRSRCVSVGSAATAEATKVLTKEDLVGYLRSGCKPREQWRFGTEHEKLGYNVADTTRISYDTIRQLLEGLCHRFGWQAIMEEGNIIGAKLEGQSVTIEPGGQFELSGAPVDSLHKTCAEVSSHLYQVKTLAEGLGVGFLGMGFDPKWRVADVPIMPKERYRIMREYMPTRGTLGHDMMFRSTTIQVNVDFESEEDMVEKMRIGIALQPLATALFANSPFRDGAATGFKSWRSHVWCDVDPDRTGILPFVWEPGFGFERYVEYALDVPMYFRYHDGRYLDATLQRGTFRDYMAGDLPSAPGELPTLKDWETHLTTIFPEVRLKRYMEMRGADGGPWQTICALPALWVGLLYDRQAQAAAYELVRDWSLEEHQYLRDAVPAQALATPFRGGTLQDLAQQVMRQLQGLGCHWHRTCPSLRLQAWQEEVLALSREGLQRRGRGEETFLAPLEGFAANGKTNADLLLERFHSEWGRSVEPLYSGDYNY